MKRILAILFSATLLFSFFGCNGNEIQNAETVITENETTAEWKKFLKEYESWVDTYVEILGKYSENPTDSEILKDYMNMTKDMTRWQTTAEEMLKDLSQEDLAEYSAELARIVAKITDIG